MEGGGEGEEIVVGIVEEGIVEAIVEEGIAEVVVEEIVVAIEKWQG